MSLVLWLQKDSHRAKTLESFTLSLKLKYLPLYDALPVKGLDTSPLIESHV